MDLPEETQKVIAAQFSLCFVKIYDGRETELRKGSRQVDHVISRW